MNRDLQPRGATFSVDVGSYLADTDGLEVWDVSPAGQVLEGDLPADGILGRAWTLAPQEICILVVKPGP